MNHLCSLGSSAPRRLLRGAVRCGRPPVTVCMLVLFALLFLGCKRGNSARPEPTPEVHPSTEAFRHETPTVLPSATVSDSVAPRGEAPGVPAPDERQLRTVNPSEESVVLAGGCFWGMEEILRGIPGVLATEVGYAGGTTARPSYDSVKTGTTGHAESVRVTFDPARLPLETLLLDWFFRMHDPTTLHRQGNDVGSQYRSAIFYVDESQRKTAESVKARVNASGAWGDPVVTQIEPLSEFTSAESYHQDYLQKNPDGYTCHHVRELSF